MGAAFVFRSNWLPGGESVQVGAPVLVPFGGVRPFGELGASNVGPHDLSGRCVRVRSRPSRVLRSQRWLWAVVSILARVRVSVLLEWLHPRGPVLAVFRSAALGAASPCRVLGRGALALIVRPGLESCTLGLWGHGAALIGPCERIAALWVRVACTARVSSSCRLFLRWDCRACFWCLVSLVPGR